MCHDLWGRVGCEVLACPAHHALLKLEETTDRQTDSSSTNRQKQTDTDRQEKTDKNNKDTHTDAATGSLDICEAWVHALVSCHASCVCLCKQLLPSLHTAVSVNWGYALILRRVCPDFMVRLAAGSHVSACTCVTSCLKVGVFVQVNASEIDDPNKPLSFGDFVEVGPCESPQLFAKHPVHLNSSN